MISLKMKFNNIKLNSVFPFILFGFVTLFLFSDFVLNKLVLIGDSDRINSFINIKLFAMANLKNLERIPTWSDNMFMGFNVTGLHWFLPQFDIVGYLQTYISKDLFYLYTQSVSFFLYFITGVNCYLFLKDITNDKFSSAIGGILYASSSIAIMRVIQVDTSYLVITLLPIGMLVTRRLILNSEINNFVYIGLIAGFLLMQCFLQEVAYALLMVSLYALYLSVMLRRWKHFIFFILAMATALVFSFPRIYTVFVEFNTIERTQSNLQTKGFEFFRLMYDGIFGRTFPENKLFPERNLNLHEGLQVYTSSLTFYCAVLFLGMLLCRKLNKKSGIFVFSLLTWFVCSRFSYNSWSYLAVCFLFAFLNSLLLYRTKISEIISCSNDNLERLDLNFAFLATIFFLAAIFWEPAGNLLYNLFLRVDFSHSRLSGVISLSIVTIVSLFLKSLISDDNSSQGKVNNLVLGSLAFVVTLLVLMAINYVTKSQLIRDFFFSSDSQFFTKNGFFSYGVIYLVITFVAFITLMFLRTLLKEDKRNFIVFLLGFTMVGDCLLYAKYQVSGAHTKTSTPFIDNNLFNISKNEINIPSENEKVILQNILQDENYRTVIVDQNNITPAYASPYVSLLWNLRLLGGYSTGVPKRLSVFGWNEGYKDSWKSQVKNLRAIHFKQWQHLDWQLLSLFNVKYAIELDKNFYLGKLDLDKLKIVENPYKPLPRTFFVKKISPMAYDWKKPLMLTPPTNILGSEVEQGVELSWSSSNLQGVEYIVERKKEEGKYKVVGKTTSLQFIDNDVKVKNRYSYRVMASHGIHQSLPSQTISIKTTKVNSIPIPRLKSHIDKKLNKIELNWSGSNNLLYFIERKNIKGDFEIVSVTTKGQSFAIFDLIDNGYKDVFRIKGCIKHSYCSRYSMPLAISSKCIGLQCNNGDAPKLMPKGKLYAGNKHLTINMLEESYVEGIDSTIDLSSSGEISAKYNKDKISIHVSPLNKTRFLVMNELYHPNWKAYANGEALKIYPVNYAMRGLFIPPNVTNVELKFEPFVTSYMGFIIMAFGLLIILSLWVYLRLTKKLKSSPAIT